ncbi:MAG TPA: hypothetical protein VIE88_08515 [Vicinamibacteria bacterium]|jgi:hypothetical protein
MSRRRIAAFTLAVALAITFAYVGNASAQCAMCRTALDQEGGQLAAGFNRAILFLLGMPYLVFGVIAGSYYWKRRKAGGALGNEGLAK